jgi:hypothetical protein
MHEAQRCSGPLTDHQSYPLKTAADSMIQTCSDCRAFRESCMAEERRGGLSRDYLPAESVDRSAMRLLPGSQERPFRFFEPCLKQYRLLLNSFQ